VSYRSILRIALLATACGVLPVTSALAAGTSAPRSTHISLAQKKSKVAAKKNHSAPKRKTHKAVTVKLPAGWPTKIIIPKIKVSAPVEALDLSKHLPQAAPFRWGDVAWYDRGPKPGQVGHAAIFGHVDSTCCPAVFWFLKDLKAGDTVEAAYKKGNPVKFRVMWSESYANTKMPIKFLFGASKQRAMVLVTCAGIYHGAAAGGYDHKLVVYARMVLPNGKLG
jgi:sortase (surface protein transpeptidase)